MKTNLTFICTHIFRYCFRSARSMTILNTDFKGLSNHVQCRTISLVGKLDILHSQCIPVAAAPTTEIYNEIQKWAKNSQLRRKCCFLNLVCLCDLLSGHVVLRKVLSMTTGLEDLKDSHPKQTASSKLKYLDFKSRVVNYNYYITL